MENSTNKIVIHGKTYERVKVDGKVCCNDCDIAKNAKSLFSVPFCWRKGNEDIMKYCNNHPDIIYKEVKTNGEYK